MNEPTYPYCVSVNGTSIELDARRLSFAMSASLAKSVSESAKRADRRDSRRRTSSKRFFNSIGGCNKNEREKKCCKRFLDNFDYAWKLEKFWFFYLNMFLVFESRYCIVTGFATAVATTTTKVVSGFV